MQSDENVTVTPPSRLVHIGPHKTGTTTVQSAFHHNRDALRSLGVHYFGAYLQPTEAAKAVAGSTPPGPRLDAGLREWERFVDEARASGCRSVVLSSEFLCEADDAHVGRILDDLGHDDTRVVVTLRPLAKIIPSQWQQFVQSGSTNRFEDWVEAVLGSVDNPQPSGFWRRHRVDRLVARWAAEVGPDRVTVVVSDDRDTSSLVREFAAMVEVPEDVLVPRNPRANRSLTWEEAEVVRHFNLGLADVNRSRAERGRVPVELSIERRLAAWGRLKSRPPLQGDHRIELPPGSVDEVASLSERLLEGIRAVGVEIVGPVEQLLARPQPGASSTPVSVDPRLVADVATGLVVELERQPPSERRAGRADVAAPVSQTRRRAARLLRAARARLPLTR